MSEATGIEDVFVYANSSEITYKIAPVELFAEMSGSAIENQDALVGQIKCGLMRCKQESNFASPINLTLIPMTWKIKINIQPGLGCFLLKKLFKLRHICSIF